MVEIPLDERLRLMAKTNNFRDGESAPDKLADNKFWWSTLR
jgi:hypothetical protein